MTEPVVAGREMIEQIFDEAADSYGRTGPDFFSHFGAVLVEKVAPAPGARVLDVGTGTGAVLIPAARRVGESGEVVGIDVAARMLERAREAVRATGLTNCKVVRMDVEKLEFEDHSFDVIIGGFSLPFLCSIETGVKEVYRVLKPGGKAGFTVWSKSPLPFDPAWKMFSEQVRKYGVEVRMPQRVAYSGGDVQALLAGCGLRDIEISAETVDAVYPTEEDWWGFQLTLASRAAIYRLPKDQRVKFKEEHLGLLRPFFKPDGLHLPAPAMYALARK